LPFLQEVNKSLRAVGTIGRYGALAQSAQTITGGKRGASTAVLRLLDRARPTKNGFSILDEADSKALLRAYGLSTTTEEIVFSAEDAAAAAERIGFPVVLKLLSHEILHKSDMGGVILGLDSALAVREAFGRLADSLQRLTGARLERALVASQVSGAVEVVLGVQRDPEVGPVVMFGGGGVLVELYRDVALGPVPLSPEAADAMIARTKVGRLLDGYRGGMKRDRAAVVSALVALGRLADDLKDHIESIDVNPFAVLPSGQDGVALDALVVLLPREGAA
jgi:acetyltransferase